MFLVSFFLFSTSQLRAETGTNELPSLSPAYPELPPTFWEQHQSALIVGGFAILAFAFFFLKVLLRPESPKIQPPTIVARQALAKLQNEPEDGSVLSAVSQILRRYVSITFDLPNNEITTSEFCAALATNEQLGTELADTITSFLKECDVRKFSPVSVAEPMNAVNRALELVQKSENHLISAGRASSGAESQTSGSSGASPHQSTAK